MCHTSRENDSQYIAIFDFAVKIRSIANEKPPIRRIIQFNTEKPSTIKTELTGIGQVTCTTHHRRIHKPTFCERRWFGMSDDDDDDGNDEENKPFEFLVLPLIQKC